MGVISNILKQVNAKTQKSLYKLKSCPKIARKTIVVAIDVVNDGRLSIMGMTASNSDDITQHFSQTRFHELSLEKVKLKEWTKKRQEQEISNTRREIVRDFVVLAIKNYAKRSRG